MPPGRTGEHRRRWRAAARLFAMPRLACVHFRSHPLRWDQVLAIRFPQNVSIIEKRYVCNGLVQRHAETCMHELRATGPAAMAFPQTRRLLISGEGAISQ